MFVGERMSRPVISVSPDAPINEVLAMFKREHIRRAPVMKDGKLAGIVSERDLLNASPSSATTLSVWELNYLISKVTVKNVMTKKVITVDVGTPIEEAARIMADKKIGGLPVVNAGKVVGMITETDLFKILVELMGARPVRVSPGVAAQSGGRGHDDPESARRYARLLISEIKLYHEPQVLAGRKERDIAARLRGEIARARSLYHQRIPPALTKADEYFQAELVRTLANGDEGLLGDGIGN